jgi:hypothetical protein
MQWLRIRDGMTAPQGKQDKPVETGPIRRFIGVLGPGLITGASDDDPSGIGTYSQAGAQLGFSISGRHLAGGKEDRRSLDQDRGKRRQSGSGVGQPRPFDRMNGAAAA